MLTAVWSWSSEEGQGCCPLMFPYHFTLLHSAYCPDCLLSTRSIQSANGWQNWFWLPLWDLSHLSAFLFLSQPTNPSPASQLVIQCGVKEWEIHRCHDESPPQSVSEQRVINCIPISVCLLLPNVFSLPQYSPWILSYSVTCWSGCWKVRLKMPLVNLHKMCFGFPTVNIWMLCVQYIRELLQRDKSAFLCKGYSSGPDTRLCVFQHLGRSHSFSASIDYTPLITIKGIIYLSVLFPWIGLSIDWTFESKLETCESSFQSRPVYFRLQMCVCQRSDQTHGMCCISIILLHYLEGMSKQTAGSHVQLWKCSCPFQQYRELSGMYISTNLFSVID